MNSIEMLEKKIRTLESLLAQVQEKHGDSFAVSAKVFADALKNGNTIFWCGNGGSAAESSHLAVELIGRFKNNRRPLPSVSLNADTSALTCIANDFGYENIFSRQLEGLGKPGDVLIVLSTSGNSQNINNALIKAKELSISSIAMLGKGGGESLSIAETVILIDSNSTARVQESHQLISHILCELIEAELGYE